MWAHRFLQNHQNHNSLLNNHRLKKNNNNNNSGIYQKRNPTSKNQKEATTRCSWKSVPREDIFNTTGLLVSIVVLKDTGSNIKSIKEAANDWMQFSLAPDDPRWPCSHSAAASARSQHPHPELGRVWRSSLHALRGTQLTTQVRILAELRRHELGETGCGICWRAFWRTQMRTPGSARRPRRQGHKLVKTERPQPVCLHGIVHCRYAKENVCLSHRAHLLSPPALQTANLICSHVLNQDEEMCICKQL